MQVGFTGTQRGMTLAQWQTLWSLLVARAPGEFHQGDCIGADLQATQGARAAGFRIVAHPPTNDSKRAFFQADESRPPLPYLDRNKRIVIAAHEIIATPVDHVESRSGTWSTIRFARRLNKPVHVILPNGRVQ